MPSDSDSALAVRDPGIPSLALVLTTAALAQRLRAALPGAADDLILEKRYIRYKPGTNCLVAYRYLAGSLSGDCYAKAYARNGVSKLRKSARRPTVPGPFGPGRIVLEDAGIAIAFSPNDDKLPGLAALCGDGHLRRLIVGAGPAVRQPSLRRLAYKPERRFVGQLAAEDGPLAVVKTYRAGAYARALQRARIADTLPAMPSLLAQNDAACAIALRWIPGRTLADLWCGDCLVRAQAREAGRRLAELHRSPSEHLSALPARSAELAAAGASELADALDWLAPAHADPARVLAARIAGLIGEVPEEAALLHGDFYARQILVAEDSVRFLDSDELCRGHPAADLGRFIADLEYEVLFGSLSPADEQTAAQALLQGYRDGGARIDTGALRAYIGLAMLQLLHRPFRECRPTWQQDIGRWITRTNQVLAGCHLTTGGRHAPVALRGGPDPVRGARSTVARPMAGRGPQCTDPRIPFLEAARDPNHATQALRRALASRCGDIAPSVLSTRLLRLKRGRRALVEYRLAPHPVLPERIVGKIRARGLDLRTWRLMEALDGGGLGDAAGAYRPAIPTPLGTLPEWRMWLQTRVPGETLWSGLLGPEPRALAEGVAEALHALHTAAVSAGRRHDIDDELNILVRRLGDAAGQRADLADRIERVRDACIAAADALRGRPTATLHRDFYPDQVLVDGMHLYLLDLDLLAEGDPALDLGNFVAHLQEHDLRVHGDPLHSIAAQSAFLRRYQTLCADTGLREAVEVYTTLALARHIDISRHFPERAPHTERILSACELRLGLHPSGHARRVAAAGA